MTRNKEMIKVLPKELLDNVTKNVVVIGPHNAIQEKNSLSTNLSMC